MLHTLLVIWYGEVGKRKTKLAKFLQIRILPKKKFAKLKKENWQKISQLKFCKKSYQTKKMANQKIEENNWKQCTNFANSNFANKKVEKVWQKLTNWSFANKTIIQKKLGKSWQSHFCFVLPTYPYDYTLDFIEFSNIWWTF